VYWDNGAGSTGDVLLYLRWVNVERKRINIHKNRSKVILQYHIRRCDKRDRRNKYFISVFIMVPFFKCCQGHLQSTGSTVAEDSVLRFVKSRELFFESLGETSA